MLLTVNSGFLWYFEDAFEVTTDTYSYVVGLNVFDLFAAALSQFRGLIILKLPPKAVNSLLKAEEAPLSFSCTCVQFYFIVQEGLTALAACCLSVHRSHL